MVRTRRLIFAALAALLFAGCTSTPAPSTAPRDSRDPDVWRPAPANYPLPR